MKKFTLFVFLVVAAILVGGGVFLAGWDIPAPQQRVEKVLPNDQFPK